MQKEFEKVATNRFVYYVTSPSMRYSINHNGILGQTIDSDSESVIFVNPETEPTLNWYDSEGNFFSGNDFADGFEFYAWIGQFDIWCIDLSIAKKAPFSNGVYFFLSGNIERSALTLFKATRSTLRLRRNIGVVNAYATPSLIEIAIEPVISKNKKEVEIINIGNKLGFA